MEPKDFRSPTPKSAAFKWRILVVDDEPGMVESLRMLLTQMGYQVSTAENGYAATEELRHNDYDVVVTDLMMDGTTGYDILEFVNAEQLNIPVLVLTGLGSVDAAVKALKQGAYDYVLKPFQFDSFRNCVRRAIEKRQLELIQRLQNQRLTAVASIAKAVTSTLNLNEIFQIIVNQSREFVEFSSAALALIDEQEKFIDLFTLLLDRNSTPQFRHRIPSGAPFFADLLDRRSAVVVSEIGRVPAPFANLVLCEGVNSFVFVPLLVKDRLVGAMFFGSKSSSAYHHQDVQLLSLMADQIAVAVDNARLLDLEQRRSQQLELINNIGKHLSKALVVEKLMETALVLLREHFSQRHIDIFYLEQEKGILIQTQQPGLETEKNTGQTQISVEEGPVSRALATGATAVFAPPKTVEGADGSSTSAILAVPLRSDGEVFGVLRVEDVEQNHFTENDIAFFEAIASQIALAWRNARLFEQIRKSKIYLELVLNAADDTSIMSIDREGRIITFNSGSETLLGLTAEEAVGRPIQEVIVSRRARVIFGNLGKSVSRDCVEEEVRISSASKKPFWARIVIRPIEPAVDLFVGFLIILTNVTQRVRLEHKLKQLTVTDDLTGLFNQRNFFEQLRREMERASRRGGSFSLCIFDLDKFKRYNDSHGHLAGDHLLKAVGKRVTKEIRTKIDTAFRYGGDEFVLILPDTSLPHAASLVDRLRAAVQREFNGAIGISAGIAEYVEGQTEKEFVEAADQLLYEAKRQGGNRAVYRLARTSTQS